MDYFGGMYWSKPLGEIPKMELLCQRERTSSMFLTVVILLVDCIVVLLAVYKNVHFSELT